MLLSEDIQDNEQLYRAIKRSKPDWLDGKNIPTSAMFKDENGVSVDRDGGRNEADVIDFMKNGKLFPRVKGIARISANDCFSCGADVKADPSKDNPYRANIFLDAEDIFRQNLQALKLARASRIVFFDDSKTWSAKI